MPDPGLARAWMFRRALGVVCLVAAAGAAAYFFLRRPAAEAPAVAASLAATAAPASSVEVATPFPVVIVPTPPRANRAAAAPVATRQPAAPPADRSVSEPASPPPRLGSARSYAGSVALAGGAKIELGGIAWSETEPRALLNDRIVGVGAFVEGYTVSKIETDRVELQKDGATIVVTVK